MQKDKIETGKPVINLEEKLKSDSMENVLERLDALEELTQPDGKGGQIVNVGDPSKDTDGVNKRYVDGNGARAYASSAQDISDITLTKIQLDAETFDIDGEFDPVTNYRFTTKKAGYYSIFGSLQINGGTNKQYKLFIYKNGASCAETLVLSNLDGYWHTLTISNVVYLAVGDYIELYCWHDYGAVRSIITGETTTFLLVYKLT